MRPRYLTFLGLGMSSSSRMPAKCPIQSSVITTKLGLFLRSCCCTSRQENCQNRVPTCRTSPLTTIANMRESNYIKLPTFTNIYTKSLLSLMVLTWSYMSLPTCANHFLCAAAHPKLTRILPGRGRAAAEIGPGPAPSSYLWELRKPLSNGSNSSCLLPTDLPGNVWRHLA